MSEPTQEDLMNEFKKSFKEFIMQKMPMGEEEYAEKATAVKFIWKTVIGKYRAAKYRVRHTLQSLSGAASTITHEAKALRQLKNIAEQLDSIKTVLRTYVDMQADINEWEPKKEEDKDKP